MNHQANNLTQHSHKFINFFLWHNGTTSGKHPVKSNEALSIFLEKFAKKISLHISAFDNLYLQKYITIQKVVNFTSQASRGEIWEHKFIELGT